jgi:hypothetical protein
VAARAPVQPACEPQAGRPWRTACRVRVRPSVRSISGRGRSRRSGLALAPGSRRA